MQNKVLVIGRYFDSQKKAEAYVNKKPDPKKFIIVEFGIEGRYVLPVSVLKKKK